MGRLEFKFNSERKHFIVPAGIRPLSPATGPPLVTAEFVLDTGSNQTCISETTATSLGIDVDNLERRQVGGIGGIVSHPFIGNLEMFLIGDDVVRVKLPEVTVLPEMKRKIEKKKGVFVQRGDLKLPAFNLLGVDVLEQLQAKLVIEMKTKKGWIEW